MNTRPAILADLHRYLIERHGGAAWFKGGSYSYLMKSSRPYVVPVSDGSVLRVQDFLEAIYDFADSGPSNDFIDADMDWGLYDYLFRKACLGQDDHEYKNLRGD